MPYNPARHHRRSIRLPHYDYSQPGAYFVTLRTQDRQPLFGTVMDKRMRLDEYGMNVSKRINSLRGTPGATVWQRNYWERFARDGHELNCIRRYIRNNPARWHQDR